MQTNIVLSSAYDVIKDTYDLQTLGDIVTNGCVSGVAHDHIYYKDTVAFFDKYEDEMVEYIADSLGDETVDSIWSQNTGNITGYKNDMTWAFIELVAMSIVDGVDSFDTDELYAIQA